LENPGGALPHFLGLGGDPGGGGTVLGRGPDPTGKVFEANRGLTGNDFLWGGGGPGGGDWGGAEKKREF